MMVSMNSMNDVMVAVIVTLSVIILGAYVLGVFHGQNAPLEWREFFASLTRRLTPAGFLWATLPPAIWLLLFHAFVAHVWFALGEWPRFNQLLDGTWVRLHERSVGLGAWGLAASLYLVPVILLSALFVRRCRHVSVYAAAYGAAVGLAFGGMFLAPRSFLNWFFD